MSIYWTKQNKFQKKYAIIYANQCKDEYYIHELRKQQDLQGQCLISQIKWIYKEVINVLHHQTLVSTANERIKKSHMETINSKYLEQHRMKNSNYLMDLILYQIFETISSISSRSIKY